MTVKPQSIVKDFVHLCSYGSILQIFLPDGMMPSASRVLDQIAKVKIVKHSLTIGSVLSDEIFASFFYLFIFQLLVISLSFFYWWADNTDFILKCSINFLLIQRFFTF